MTTSTTNLIAPIRNRRSAILGTFSKAGRAFQRARNWIKIKPSLDLSAPSVDVATQLYNRANGAKRRP